jgi:nucleotide-binding universal stress UspA family protein
MMLKNILVATDMSEPARSVYRWAAAAARHLGGRITLLNVDETSQFEWPSRSLQGSHRLKQLIGELAQRRQAELGAIRVRLEDQGLHVRVKTVVGRASDRILDHASFNEVDLLVLGRRGARITERFTLGSTTKRVLRRVRVPTLVVPGSLPPDVKPFDGRRIIAATAFSGACLMALDATLELAEALSAEVDYVHVVRLPVPFSVKPAQWPDIVGGETREQLEHMHLRDLSEQLGRERAARCRPYTTIGVSISGSLRDLALETGADLIALPSHSSGKKNPPRFGSTTENVVRRSTVPVLVYPVRYLEERFGMVRDED